MWQKSLGHHPEDRETGAFGMRTHGRAHSVVCSPRQADASALLVYVDWPAWPPSAPSRDRQRRCPHDTSQ